jgi:predicted ATP-binding protein involved in virulence
MEKLWKILPIALAIVAIAVVLLQRADIRSLEARLAQQDRARPARSTASRTVEPAEATDRGLERRLNSLEQTVARMFQMVLSAGRGKAKSDTAPAGSAAQVNDLREDVDALLTGEALNTDQGRKQLHQIVRQVQEELHQERREQWRKMRDQMHKDRLNRLAKEAGLSTNQVERLSSLMDGERTQRRTLMRAARRGEIPFSQVRDGMRTLRQTTDQQAREFLSSSQYTAFEKMRQEGGWGRRRWH